MPNPHLCTGPSASFCLGIPRELLVTKSSHAAIYAWSAARHFLACETLVTIPAAPGHKCDHSHVLHSTPNFALSLYILLEDQVYLTHALCCLSDADLHVAAC